MPYRARQAVPSALCGPRMEKSSQWGERVRASTASARQVHSFQRLWATARDVARCAGQGGPRDSRNLRFGVSSRVGRRVPSAPRPDDLARQFQGTAKERVAGATAYVSVRWQILSPDRAPPARALGTAGREGVRFMRCALQTENANGAGNSAHSRVESGWCRGRAFAFR